MFPYVPGVLCRAGSHDACRACVPSNKLGASILETPAVREKANQQSRAESPNAAILRCGTGTVPPGHRNVYSIDEIMNKNEDDVSPQIYCAAAIRGLVVARIRRSPVSRKQQEKWLLW